MNDAVKQIKTMIENAIITEGTEGKNNLIRTSTVINLIHNAVKKELRHNAIDWDRIVPPLNETKGEMDLFGELKKKAQDICVKPLGLSPKSSKLNKGAEIGKTDAYGKEYTERVLSINVRSQLSSLAKNFDTLYERTFAESYNLHCRCPKMVLGDVYLIPVYEYDDKFAKNKEVKFKQSIKNVEKYIAAFQEINLRNREGIAEEHKYEKICLLIVDFSKDIPKIYNSTAELIEDNLLPANTTVSLNDLSFNNFVPYLVKLYDSRFLSIDNPSYKKEIKISGMNNRPLE